MLSGAVPFHLLGKILMIVFQNHILLAGFIENNEAASCHRLLMSYSCYPLSSLLLLVQIYNSWWAKFLLDAVKQGLKHPLLIFLFPSVLQYLERHLIFSACGASIGI